MHSERPITTSDESSTALAGGGFLTDHFPAAAKAIWQFDGIWATSRHIPGVRFPGLIHPGLIGTAPSQVRGLTRKTRQRENDGAGRARLQTGTGARMAQQHCQAQG